MAGLSKYFTDTPYQVVDGNVAYASNLNNPFTALATGVEALSVDVQTGSSRYAIDTGETNAYVVSLDPPPTAYKEGLEVWIKPSTTNTGPSTINVNSLGVIEIKRHNVEDVLAGDIPANYFTMLKYSNGCFLIVSASGRGRSDVAEDAAEASAEAAATSAAEAAASAVEARATTLTQASTQTSSFTPERSIVYPIDSSGGAFDITLPENPSDCDIVFLIGVDGCLETTPCYIRRNGSVLHGLEDDWILNRSDLTEIWFVNNQWRFKG